VPRIDSGAAIPTPPVTRFGGAAISPGFGRFEVLAGVGLDATPFDAVTAALAPETAFARGTADRPGDPRTRAFPQPVPWARGGHPSRPTDPAPEAP
jgi:hypothetical protein